MVQLEEYEAVRKRAGLIECAALGLVEIRGSDRIAFLHNLLTQDIEALQPGSAREAALVTPAAKLLADMVVWAEADAHWLIVPRSRVDMVFNTLEHYLISEDVALHDRSADHRVLALQGPASQPILSELPGIQMRAVAHSLTGSPGFLIIVPADQSATLQESLLRSGRVQPVGLETLNVLRIEAGIPWYGVDMNEANLLPETGLQARAVSDRKGCYVGQEVIARMTTYGSASRKLMGLACEGNDVPAAKDPIMSAGGGSAPGGKDAERVGEITSACFSPALKRPIALGYVKRPYYEAGMAVTIMRDGISITAGIVKLPFVQSIVHRP